MAIGDPGAVAEAKRQPTGDDLIGRAVALRERLRGQQGTAEEVGHYGEDIHDAFLRAEFYHMLTPKRYGGLEIDLPTYLKVVLEIARGCPSSAWCFALAHGHNLTTGSHWLPEAQDAIFVTEDGYYRASHSVANAGTAEPAPGGYRITCRSPYQSGVPYSTHATVNVRRSDESGEPPPVYAAIVPRGLYTVLDDWGGETTLGQRGSGSNTVVVEGSFIEEGYMTSMDWMHDYVGHSVGTELHDNVMYLGPVGGFFHSEFAAIMTGAAHAAADEYERIITTRTSNRPPYSPRAEDPNHLADLGMAITMADAAEAAVIRLGQLYMEYCEGAVHHSRPFTREMDSRLYGIAQRSAQMATEAIEMLFFSAGSSAGKGGQPMQRYFRDASMYRGHASAQYRWAARRFAELHLANRTPSEG